MAQSFPDAPTDPPYGATIQSAILFAVESHRRHFRKRERAGVYLPYITHPLEVMKILWVWETIDATTAVAAVLHDVLEDTSGTEDDISHQFGWDVLAVVKELTHKPEVDSPELKEQYMGSFAGKSVRALVIKVADRLCNVYDMLPQDPKYARKYLLKAQPLWDHLTDGGLDRIAKEWGEGPAERVGAAVGWLKNKLNV